MQSKVPLHKSPLAQAVQSALPDELPVVFLPYQKRWVEMKSPLKVAEKSRRIGLTWAEAADNVLTAAAKAGQTVYYLGYNQDMTVEYIQCCAAWARAFDYAASEIKEGIWEDDDADKAIKTYTIKFPSGFRIVALTSRPSNLRGRQGVVVIDEAAFHCDLAELLKAALALLIWGGEVHVISTHDGADNPFNELVQEIRAGKRKGDVFRCSFKEAVADGLYQRVCLRKNTPLVQADEEAWVQDVYDFYGDAAEEELDCVPSQGSGAWLSLALLENRTSEDTPVLRLNRPIGWETQSESSRLADLKEWCDEQLLPVLVQLAPHERHFYGMDFGRSGDLSVIWLLAQGQDMRRRTPFIVELRNVPFKEQEELLFYLVEKLPHFQAGSHDARGNGSQLAESAAVRYGFTRIKQVMFTEAWYRENMPKIKAALEDGDFYNLPKNKDVIDDFRLVRVVKGVPRIPDQRSGQKGSKRHGDSAIAAALAYTTTVNPPAPIEFTPIPNHSRWDENSDHDFGNWKGTY